jgi:hypothetical protein
MKIEREVRNAIRDAVNRASRKPFYWGGLKGYQQLEAIADGLRQMQEGLSHTRTEKMCWRQSSPHSHSFPSSFC